MAVAFILAVISARSTPSPLNIADVPPTNTFPTALPRWAIVSSFMLPSTSMSILSPLRSIISLSWRTLSTMEGMNF